MISHTTHQLAIDRQTFPAKFQYTLGNFGSEHAAQPNQNRALRVVSEKFVDTETNVVCYLFSQ